jgi:hypothetical protein
VKIGKILFYFDCAYDCVLETVRMVMSSNYKGNDKRRDECFDMVKYGEFVVTYWYKASQCHTSCFAQSLHAINLTTDLEVVDCATCQTITDTKLLHKCLHT